MLILFVLISLTPDILLVSLSVQSSIFALSQSPASPTGERLHQLPSALPLPCQPGLLVFLHSSHALSDASSWRLSISTPQWYTRVPTTLEARNDNMWRPSRPNTNTTTHTWQYKVLAMPTNKSPVFRGKPHPGCHRDFSRKVYIALRQSRILMDHLLGAFNKSPNALKCYLFFRLHFRCTLFACVRLNLLLSQESFLQ